jgi:hypothetical protein
LLVNAPSLKTGWVNRFVVAIGTFMPVSSRAFLNAAMARSRSGSTASRSSSWKVTPYAPSSDSLCTVSTGSSGGLEASPNGSRACQPTVQRPKVKRSAGVGVYSVISCAPGD